MESFENVFLFQKKNRSVSRVDKRNKGEELLGITRLLPTQSNKSRDHDIFAVVSRIKHFFFFALPSLDFTNTRALQDYIETFTNRKKTYNSIG